MFSKKIKHLAIALFIAVSGGLIVAPAITSADFQGDACQGVNSLNGSNSAACSSDSASTLTTLLHAVINILSIVVGVVAIIMIIVGGLRFITSGGDSSNTASARNTVLYAIIGLVIAVLAQVIIHFVLFRTSGAAVCQYNGNIAASSSQCVPPSHKKK